MADVVCEEYATTLRDLTFNSKPHISMLTMLAEENQQYAPKIVQAIEAHLQKVRPETKLPAIYLIDSIVKNVGGDYLGLFTQNLVSTFCSVFEKVDEKTRIQLFKLRQTWSDVFPARKLHAIDVRVRQMDPAWPVAIAQSSIHVNPKFLKTAVDDDMQKNNQEIQEAEMRKQLIAKQQELLKLQQQKLELELLQTKAKLEEQKKLLHPPGEGPTTPPAVPSIRPFSAGEEHLPVRKPAAEVPPVRKIVVEPPKPQVPAPVKSAIVMPHPPPIPVPTTSRPQSVVVPPKDPRLMRDPRLSRDTRSFHAALVPVNAGPTPAVPVTNKRNNDKMVEKAHVNLSVPSNHTPRSGNEQSLPIVHNRETLKSAVVFQPPRGVDKKNEPCIKNDRIPKKKPDNESKKSSPKSDVKAVKSSPVKEGSKRDVKKKSETPSPKKNVVHKKDDLLKQTDDKPKSTEKIKKPKLEAKVVVEPLKERRGAGRNSGGSSTRPSHDYKNDEFSGKGGFRQNRRNYRTNRNRSAPPDTQSLGRVDKLAEKDDGGNTDKDRNGGRARSRSPIRTNRNTDKDDKKLERNAEKVEKKKKASLKEIESTSSGVADKESKKTGLKELNTDVDLRAINPSSPKRTDKSVNSDVDAKENVDASPAAEEPPLKKARQDEEAQLDTLFGNKDQDYRQIPPNAEQGGQQLESPRNRSWAKYKAEHPDEFKNPTTPRSLKENARREPYGFSNFDQDFRGTHVEEYYPQGNSMDTDTKQPKFTGFHRGRNRRGFPNEPRMRGFGRGRGRFPGRQIDDPRVLQRHPVYQRLHSREENAADPNLDIPHALLLSKQAEILRQADQQLKSGHLTREQHQELLNQLGKLYELQTLRQKQKEEELREKIFLRNESQRREFPQFGRDRPPFPSDPRFPHDSNKQRFSAAAESAPGVDSHQMKVNRKQGRNKVLRSRQSEVLHSVAEELEHVQRSCKTEEINNVGAVSGKEDKPLPVPEKRPMLTAHHIRNIAIDGKMMQLVFFGTVAVVLHPGDPPREITFKGKGHRQKVYLDDYTLKLGFKGETMIADIEGKSHSFKFGAPTREIYIDDVPQEIQFGGPPKPIILSAKPRLLRLGGPPPDVEFMELRPALEGDVTKLMLDTGFMEKTGFSSNDSSSKDATSQVQSEDQPPIQIEIDDTPPKLVAQSTGLDGKEKENQTELPIPKDIKKELPEKPEEGNIAIDLHNSDSQSSIGTQVKPENENRDVDLRVAEPLEPTPRPPIGSHRQSPIPVMATPVSIAQSEQVGRTASPARFVDSPSRSPVYRGSFTNPARPDYHEFRAVHSEEGDKDYRDIRTFSQVDSVIFKEEPLEPKFQPQEERRENLWPEPSWRENANRYLDAPVLRSEHPQAGGYNQHEQVPPRDEYVPEYWPPHRQEEAEFQRKQNFFRGRGGRQNSPQRVPTDYPVYRDNAPPHAMSNEGNMRMDFPMYRPNTNVGIRAENLRPRYEPLRPPFEPPPGLQFEMPRPNFENPVRSGLGERGPALQPPPNFYPNGPPGMPRPPFPDQRPEFLPPVAEIPPFGPLSSVLPAGTPVNQGGLPSVPPPFVLPPQMDVAALFQKLVSAGIINSSAATSTENTSDSVLEAENKEKDEEHEAEEEKVPHIEFTSESLRGHYAGVIGNLFRGIQCSSCGLRFTSEQTEKYALHLDWHFRQNRRERDGAKKAVSRKWYYDVQDWIQFEEIEDMEDRARSLFEVQANEEAVEHIDDLHTVPVGENDEDNTCVVCGEPFEQFWDQEKEEWHLRDSFRVENKTYHPGCYEDIKNVAVVEPVSEVVPDKPVRVSWQDKPEKKAVEEKKSDTPSEKKSDVPSEEKSGEPLEEKKNDELLEEKKSDDVPSEKKLEADTVKIKQEKMDVEEDAPSTSAISDVSVIVKLEKDPSIVEVPVPAVVIDELAISSETPMEVAPPEESSVEPLTVQPVQVVSNDSEALEPSTTVLPSVNQLVGPSDESTGLPSGDSLVVPPGEPAVELPEMAVALSDEPSLALPDESVASSGEPVAEPPDQPVSSDVPLVNTSEDVLPTGTAQVPECQITDAVPVDEMDQLKVTVEPEEVESLLQVGVEMPNSKNESQDGSVVVPIEMDRIEICQEKPSVENDERTLLFPDGIKIKQEPVEHDEMVIDHSVDRTSLESNIQKPPSPLGETIEKVLEGSSEVKVEPDDPVNPTPGFTVFPPVMRGTELSGLCSIM